MEAIAIPHFKSTEPIQKTEFATQLVRDKKRWFACIPVIEEVELKELDKVIALDPGVRTFLTGFDGDSFQEFGKARQTLDAFKDCVLTLIHL